MVSSLLSLALTDTEEAFSKSELSTKPKELSKYLSSKIEHLIISSNFKSVESATPSINRLSEELFYRFNISMVAKINKILRKKLPDLLPHLKDMVSFSDKFICDEPILISEEDTKDVAIFTSLDKKVPLFSGKNRREQFIKESLLNPINLISEREMKKEIS